MNNSMLFQKARESLTEDDFYEVKELKNEERKREIEEELGFSDKLMRYEDVVDIAKYLEVDVKNIYVSRAGFFDMYSYLDKELGLLVSLFDGKIETIKKLRIKEVIEFQKNSLRRDLKNGDYRSYFFMVDSKIKLMMMNKIFENIPESQKYKAFKDIYSSSDYGFDMINKDIFHIIRDSLGESDLLTIKNLADKDGYVSIYRGVASQSTELEEAFSWTTDIFVAMFFANRFENQEPEIYKGSIHYKDVIAFIERRGEKEIIAFHEDISSIEEVELLTLNELLWQHEFLREIQGRSSEYKAKSFP